MQDHGINVSDFGAKGDGIADDTAAINAAFAAMRKAAINTHPTLPRQWGGGEWFPGTCPAVVFPCGHYKISDAIDIAGHFSDQIDRDMGAHTIRGDNAVIDQTDPEKDIFVSTYSVMTHITGFKFVGGRRQVWLDNPNVGAFVKVTDCEFHESFDFAVVFGYRCNSTLVYMACCAFVNCEQWIYTMADMATFRDVTGGSRPGMSHKAAFDIRGGIVTMDNIMATPWADGVDQRFIDNRSSQLKLSNWRFGGEFGGFLPIRNFTKYSRDLIGSSIVVDNCFLANQSNTKRPGVIYCDEVPNRIVVTNSTVVGIPVITVDPRIDLNTYFEGVSADNLKFVVENCMGQLGDMPEGLKTPIVTPVPDKPGLSDAEVAQRLEKAAEFIAQTPPCKGPPATYGGHREQTDPAKYMNLPGSQGQWTVEGHADAETTPNAKLYAVSAREGGVIVMPRHQAFGSGWALLKDVAVDLDRHPWLTYRIKPFDYGYRPCFLRVIDKESGNGLQCTMPVIFAGKHASPYYAYDLRRFFGGGVHTIDVRVYVLGDTLFDKDAPEIAKARESGGRAQPWGDKMLTFLELDRSYTVFEYMRAEAE